MDLEAQLRELTNTLMEDLGIEETPTTQIAMMNLKEKVTDMVSTEDVCNCSCDDCDNCYYK